MVSILNHSSKHILLFTLGAGFLIFLTACADNRSSSDKMDAKIDSLQKTTMAIHDEVMPRMSELNRMSRKLKQISLNQYPSVDSTVLNKHIRQLDLAGEGMMNWMAEYNPSVDTLPDKKAVRYLKNEKKKIQRVADQMNSTLSNAKKWYRDEIEQK